jgi:hypothetical protein
MQKPVSIEGKEVILSTITVGALEDIELTGKAGRKWNIAMIAASILASGDTERGTEAWVRGLPAFDPEGGDSPFKMLIDAANAVNGFDKVKVPEKNAQAPDAPAAG